MSLHISEGLSLCADSQIFLQRFDEPRGSKVLALGDNDEHSAQVLHDNGYTVLGVDLLPLRRAGPPSYFRLQGDFVRLAERGVLPEVDCAYSLSALEHFGLGTYPGCPGNIDLYDQWACQQVALLLRPGGAFYLTVPYGKEFLVHGKDWRVYDRGSLHERLIVPPLQVEQKVFFKSSGADVPDADGLVTEENADTYSGRPPHLTVLLKLRKP